MADRYVYNNGGTASAGDWTFGSVTNVYLSIDAAMADTVAGDNIYVADDHLIGYDVNKTWNFPNNVRVLCINRATGVRSTMSSSYYDGQTNTFYGLTLVIGSSDGCVFFDGIHFRVTSTTTIYSGSQKSANVIFNRCRFTQSANFGELTLGTNSYSSLSAKFINCTIDLARTGNTHGMELLGGVDAEFIGTVFENISTTGYLISDTGGYGDVCTVTIRNTDLSSFARLLSVGTGKSALANLFLEDCRLPSSWTTLQQNVRPSQRITTRRCSGDTLSTANTRDLNIYQNGHTVSFDQTVSRSGSDSENSYSIKMVSSSGAHLGNPARLGERLAIWHDGTGSQDLTVHMWANDSGLYDDDIWAIVTYPDTAATAYQQAECVSTFPTAARAAAGTSTYLDNDSEGGEWSGSGGTTTYQIKVTGINPTNPGYVYVDLFLTKPSTTVWVCPDMTLA